MSPKSFTKRDLVKWYLTRFLNPEQERKGTMFDPVDVKEAGLPTSPPLTPLFAFTII